MMALPHRVVDHVQEPSLKHLPSHHPVLRVVVDERGRAQGGAVTKVAGRRRGGDRPRAKVLRQLIRG